MSMEVLANYKKHMGSAAMTFIVASLLFFSGPASALNININSLSGSHRQGQEIKFGINVGINRPPGDELVTIQYANVTFTFPDGTKRECKIVDNETVEGCDFLSVRKIDVAGDEDFGYGYESAHFNNTDYFLGYGYGYGYGNASARVKYRLEINSSALPAGTYYALADVLAGTTSPKIFSSRTTKFKIFAPKTKEKKKGHGSEVDDEDESEDSGPGIAATDVPKGKTKLNWTWAGVRGHGNKNK